MSESRAKKLLAEAANCDPAAIADDAAIGSFEFWDSLAHLRWVLALEERTATRPGRIRPDRDPVRYLALLAAIE